MKLYTVLVGRGSGCLFQPMTDVYTYILTAKHLFIKEGDDGRGGTIGSDIIDGEVIEIKRHRKTENGWEEITVDFKLEKGTTFFPHKNADIAILKIDYLKGFDGIHVRNEFEADNNFVLCGFPENNRIKNPGDRYTTHSVKGFVVSGNYVHTAQLFETLSLENIKGMSGGGILKVVNGHLAIIGIQSSMANRSNYQAGQIEFVPMKYFNEIVDEYKEKIEKLLPPYLRSFSFLKEDIFNIECGLLEKARAEKLTTLLKKKATEIQHSDITPQVIRDHLQEKLLLLSNQNEDDLQKKRIWAIWLELLTILNIAKNKSHCANDLPSIFKKVRLFYSDIDKDFWTEHLNELAKLDYSGLEGKGIVVVASNVEAKGQNMHILDLSRITVDIARIQNEFDTEQFGEKIDTATDFPLKKYQYINISAFKEKTAADVAEKFTQQNMNDCLVIIKGLYEQLIPNW